VKSWKKEYFSVTYDKEPQMRSLLVRRLIPVALPVVLILALFAISQGNTLAAGATPALAKQVVSLKDKGQSPDPFSYQVLVVLVSYNNDRATLEALTEDYDVWEVDRDHYYVTLQVSHEEYMALEAMGYRIEVDHVLSRKYSDAAMGVPDVGGGIPGYACYRTVEETLTTADDLAAAYPNLAEVVDIGDSWEKTQNAANGYDLVVLRITNRSIPGPKPTFFSMSAIHAREYTTAELNTRFGEWLLNNYGTNADATWIVDHHDIHLLLQANPDGRKRAETGISWRKNTNNNFCANTNTRGIDLNRNYPFEWGCCGGSSTNQCSLTYRGPSPNSEPETQAVTSYVPTIFPDQRDAPITATAPLTSTGIFMDIHSAAGLVLWPWGFTNQETGNATSFRTLGRKFAFHNDYEPIQAIELYPTDGTTDDFAYGDLGVAAYTFELGNTFFEPCANFENTIYPDNLDALIYAAKVLRTPYITPAGPDSVNVAVSQATVQAGTAVTVTAQVTDNRFSTNNGTEPTQPISAARVYVDTPPWGTAPAPIALQAADGTFDTVSENVTGVIDTTGLSVGRHILFVEGVDQANSIGALSAVFLDITEPPTAVSVGTLESGTSNVLPYALALVGLVVMLGVGLVLRRRA
jgi:carboxypeptidase T